MKVRFGFLVTNGDRIVVVDGLCGHGHDIVTQSLLELWRHKVVTRTTSAEDSKVNLEPEQIEEEWDNNKTNSSSNKMLGKVLERESLLDVQKVPEIHSNGTTNGNKGEETDVFGGDNAGQGNSSGDKPFPPFTGKWLVSVLGESDICEERTSH